MDKSALIYKVLSGTATPREKQQLQEWKDLSAENEKEFNDIELLWDNSSDNDPSANEQGWKKIKSLAYKRKHSRKRNRLLRFILIVMCALTIIILLWTDQ